MNDDTALLGPGARIAYVFVTASDLARTVTFYEDVLGFARVFLQEETCAFLRLGVEGPQLAIYRDDAKRRAGSLPLLAIDVEDLDSARRALKTAGVAVGEIVDVPGGRAVTFSDPEGNLVELHEPARR